MKETIVSGFDMTLTGNWYSQNLEAVFSIANKSIEASEGQKITDETDNLKANFFHSSPWPDNLDPETLIKITNYLVPRNALERALSVGVMVQQPAWFHKCSTPETQIRTHDPALAMAATTVIPSYIGYSWNYAKKCYDAGLIEIFEITAFPKKVALMMQLQGYFHELGHALALPAWTERYDLLLPGRRQVNGEVYIRELGEMLERLPAISHYAHSFRDLPLVDPEDTILLAVQEELAEMVAAFLLGFAFCETVPGREEMGLDPFQDRPEVEQWVAEFLNAEAVPKGSA